MTKEGSWQVRIFGLNLPVTQLSNNRTDRLRVAALISSLVAHILLALAFWHGNEISSVDKAPSNSTSLPIVVSVLYPSNKNDPESKVLVEAPDLNLQAPSQIQQSPNRAGSSAAPIHIRKTSQLRYFLSKELTEKPLVLRDIPPDLGALLPDVASQRVKVWLYINETGDIDGVQLESSALPEYAESLLTDQFKKMKFYPGKTEGIAVKTKLRIEIIIEADKKLEVDSNRSLTQ